MRLRRRLALRSGVLLVGPVPVPDLRHDLRGRAEPPIGADRQRLDALSVEFRVTGGACCPGLVTAVDASVPELVDAGGAG